MDRQLSLFEATNSVEEVVSDYLGVHGLRYCERFLDSEEQRVTLSAVDSLEWQYDLKRRVQHYGYKYDYKKRRVDPSMYVGQLPEFADRIGTRLVDKGLLTAVPDQLIVNEYEPGQGITPHVDCEPCFHDEIATISLCSVYTMDLTKIGSEQSVSIALPIGSCLVFTGESRFSWKHGIKPRLSDNGRRRGRRISLTFRRVILANE